MRRYVFTALCFGGFSSLLVAGLFLLGLLDYPGARLVDLFRVSGLLHGEETNRMKWLEIVFAVASGTGVAWWVVDVPRISQKILVALASVLLTAGLSLTLALYNFFFDPTVPMLTLLLVMGAGLVFARTEWGRRKRTMEEVVGPRISRRVFHQILEAPSPPQLDGAEREVTVLSCRIFFDEETRAKLEPEERVRMANLFLRNVSNFLTSRGSCLDDSEPELVRGTFGMLSPAKNHAALACEAALELRSRLRSLSRECESRWFRPLLYGVGISSGRVTSGVFGSGGELFFSAIGGEIDFSRRLAGANLRYGSRLLVGPNTYRLVAEEFEVRPMEMFYDPEAELMTEIYELLSSREAFAERDRERRDCFWEGVIRLRERRYDEALERLSRARNAAEDDGPLDYFLQRAQAGVSGDVEKAEGRSVLTSPESGHARLIDRM